MRTLKRLPEQWPDDADIGAVRSVTERLIAAAQKVRDYQPATSSDQEDDLFTAIVRDAPTTGWVAPYRRRDGTYVRGYRRR